MAIVEKLASGRFLGKLHKSMVSESARFSEACYERGQHQPLHTHELPHVALTVRGAYRESIRQITRSIPAGSLTFYHPEMVHTETHLSDGVHFLIEFHPDRGSMLERILPQFIRDPIDSGPHLALAWRLYREFRQPDDFSGLLLEGLALELLAESFRTAFTRTEKRCPRWIRTALEILSDHFPVPPPLSLLARELGIHPVHLAKTFRHFQGVTIGEHVRQLRIDYARERLIHSAASLSRIAMDAGFSDQAHFTKTFKRLTGITPGRYRKAFQS